MKNKIDAIILAGDKTASRGVCGKNKLFLEIEGAPLLCHVLKALEDVDMVGKITIVGPKGAIEELLKKHRPAPENRMPVDVIEQKENMLRNFWAGFVHGIPGYRQGIEKEDKEIMEKIVLVLPCDLPLITSREIREFLEACPINDLDYCLGMTEEKSLEKFYPSGSKPGIKMAYLSMREGNFRINNLHLVRPFMVHNREYIETIYERRYQKNIINIAKMVFDFIFLTGMSVKTIILYSKLELSVLFMHFGLNSLAQVMKNMVSQEEIRACASGILKTRIDIVETTLGGSAMDIDNEEDFEVFKLRFREWMEILEKT